MKLFGIQFFPPTQTNAVADVSIILESDRTQLTINNAQLLKNPEGGLWLGMPRHAMRQSSGRYLHVRTVELTRAFFVEVQDAVIQHYHAWVRAQSAEVTR